MAPHYSGRLAHPTALNPGRCRISGPQRHGPTRLREYWSDKPRRRHRESLVFARWTVVLFRPLRWTTRYSIRAYTKPRPSRGSALPRSPPSERHPLRQSRVGYCTSRNVQTAAKVSGVASTPPTQNTRGDPSCIRLFGCWCG